MNNKEHFLIKVFRAGVTSQPLGAGIALSEVPSSVPTPTSGHSRQPVLQPFWSLQAPELMCTYTPEGIYVLYIWWFELEWPP